MSETPTHASANPHKLLLSCVGKWQGSTKTWFEPGVTPDDSPWKGEIVAILGDRYLQYDYTGQLQGESFEGKAIIGLDPTTTGVEMAWIDSFHQSAGIMHCKGSFTATGFSVLGSYHAGDTDWGWRTNFELLDANHLTIRAYNITPDGQAYLGIETVYTRG